MLDLNVILASLALTATPGLTAGPAEAGAGPAGPELTLEEALKQGSERNLDLKAAAARLGQARAGVWKAWSGYLPQVTAGASWTRNDQAVGFSLQVDPGPPPVSVDITIQKLDQLGAQVQASQALIAPALWFGIEASYRGEAVAEWSVEGARREVLFGVAQVYYAVASLKKAQEVSQRLLEIAGRSEKDAEVRYRAGTIARVGLLRAQIDRARAEQDLKRAENSYQSARISLATLLDRAPDFEVVEPVEPELAVGEGTSLEEQALSDRADLKAARAAEALQQALRKSAWAGYLPSLGAFYRHQWSNTGGFTGSAETWAAGVALSWNLFDGGRREAEIREAGARVAEAEAARRSAEVKAQAEVRQALLDLGSARANAAKAREQRDLAAENQRLVDVAYKAGAATAVEQADATAALRNSELALSAETLASQLAVLKVLKSAGSFDPVPRRR